MPVLAAAFILSKRRELAFYRQSIFQSPHLLTWTWSIPGQGLVLCAVALDGSVRRGPRAAFGDGRHCARSRSGQYPTRPGAYRRGQGASLHLRQLP